MKATFVSILLLSCALSAAQPGGVRAQILDVSLLGASVVPPSGSTGWGDGHGTGDCLGSLLMEGGFGSLLSPPIAVEFHFGSANENGPLVRAITDLNGEGNGVFSFTANFPLTEAACDSLNRGSMYVVVTTEAFPNGEIRGQIVVSPDATKSTSWGSLKLQYR